MLIFRLFWKPISNVFISQNSSPKSIKQSPPHWFLHSPPLVSTPVCAPWVAMVTGAHFHFYDTALWTHVDAHIFIITYMSVCTCACGPHSFSYFTTRAPGSSDLAASPFSWWAPFQTLKLLNMWLILLSSKSSRFIRAYRTSDFFSPLSPLKWGSCHLLNYVHSSGIPHCGGEPGNYLGAPQPRNG